MQGGESFADGGESPEGLGGGVEVRDVWDGIGGAIVEPAEKNRLGEGDGGGKVSKIHEEKAKGERRKNNESEFQSNGGEIGGAGGVSPRGDEDEMRGAGERFPCGPLGALIGP